MRDRELKRKADHEYYLKNKEARRAYSREYAEKNRAKIAASGKAWRLANQEHKKQADKEWRLANAEQKRATNSEWYQGNKDRYRAIDLKRNYGITVEYYDALDKQQAGKCAICGGVNKNGKRLAVDHEHKTGKVRGLLCLPCNLLLGNAEERVPVLVNAIEYLEKHALRDVT